MQGSIDIFNIHEKIMDDYKHFVGSFINIKDRRIREVVESEIDDGKYWPEPLIQFNPSFEEGESIEKLSEREIIHPEVAHIFKGYSLFRHQAEALKKGVAGSDFVGEIGVAS